MEYNYDKSWNILEGILKLKLPMKDAWSRFIEQQEHYLPIPVWLKLKQLQTENDKKDIVNWVRQVEIEDPIPKNLVAIWIGIVLLDREEGEVPAICLQGSEIFDDNNIDWAITSTYLPRNRYAIPTVFHEINEIIKSDINNFEFLDWIVPLAYCAFMFDDIVRDLNKELFEENLDKIYFTIGYDGGDYVKIARIE